MYHIFICDDEKRELGILREKLEICLQKQKKEYEIQEFSDGNRLLEELKHQIPQMIFLDIEMPDISGMELAEQIFSSHINTNIIFVTNRDELVFQAIHYQPFRFIRKDELDNELEEAISNLIQKLEKDEQILEVQTKQGIEFLPLKNILYIESCKHYLRIRHVDGECEMRGKISNLEKWMTNYGFIQTHRSYLVNMRFMKMVRTNEVELDNGELLSVSRDKVQDVREKQMIYLRSFAYADN
jgi:two-component system, LytTR family, response regulator LytT